MIKHYFYYYLCWMLLAGTALPVRASEAHPKGPEGVPFVEHTIRLKGNTRNLVVTYAYPTPDSVVDWAPEGEFDVSGPHKTARALRFRYEGYFWQGHFGSVAFDILIKKRMDESEPWTDVVALQKGIRAQHYLYVDDSYEGHHRDGTQTWMRPFVSQLNGVACVQQFVGYGKMPKAASIFYIPFEGDYALQLEVQLVDNSNRPGLPPSDWLPRAKSFAEELLSTVRIQTEFADSWPQSKAESDEH